MKRLSSLQSAPDVILARLFAPAAFAPAAFVLCCVLPTLLGGAALAQTGNLADPSPTAAQSSPKEDDPPPGGCKPIGLTVSGEVVFPFECKEFIERQKAMISKPAAAETNPAAAEVKSSAAEPARPPAAEAARPLAAEEKPAVAEAKPGPAAEKPAVVEDKPAAVQDKPAAAEEKPGIAEPKTASKPPEDAAPDNSQASVKSEPVPMPRRGDRRQREHTASTPNCMQYRTYNPASGTYRGFDGRTRPCR
jgi:pyruvate/2-oxoglutarate dehydrogenase complex dihydrolipoamide acyltransferase (E2) component